MFEIDEHLINQIFVIGLIVLFIVLFLDILLQLYFQKLCSIYLVLKLDSHLSHFIILIESIKNIKDVFGRKIGGFLYNNFYYSYDGYRRICICIN